LAIPSKVWVGPHQVGFTVRMTMAMEYGGFSWFLSRWLVVVRFDRTTAPISSVVALVALSATGHQPSTLVPAPQ
jgi:hypothetical protein